METAARQPVTAGSELVEQVRARLKRAGNISNGCGAIDTFVFLMFLLPPLFKHADTERYIVINAIVFAIYLPATFVIAPRLVGRLLAPLNDWVGRRPPTVAERDAALGIARGQAVISARFWAIAALLFGAINVTEPGAAAIIVVTLLLGGVTTASMNYLSAERALRPITTEALSAAPPAAPAGPGVSTRVTMVWLVATGVPLLGIGAVALAGLLTRDVDGHIVAAGILFIAAVAAISGLVATGLNARGLGESLGGMRGALARIEEGDYDVHVEVDDASEVGQLQTGFNRMAAGLAERERLQDLFGRHVGRDVASAALDAGVELGGESRDAGVLVVDLIGSTSMASRLTPEHVVATLNEFFRIVVEVVEAHGGFVNKFQGDGALCLFGAPAPSEDPAGAALAAARELCARLAAELPDVDFGIGVSAGETVAGNVGAEQRFEYTVVGDPVNEAARLSELAKRLPERVLASGAAVERADPREREHWELGDEVELRGRDEPTRLATISPSRPGSRGTAAPPDAAPAPRL